MLEKGTDEIKASREGEYPLLVRTEYIVPRGRLESRDRRPERERFQKQLRREAIADSRQERTGRITGGPKEGSLLREDCH